MHTQEIKQKAPPPKYQSFSFSTFIMAAHAKATLILRSLALQNISINKNSAEESVLPIMLLQLNLYLVFPQLAYV